MRYAVNSLLGVMRFAAVIEDPSSQQGCGLLPRGPMVVHLFGQLGLDGIEQVPLDNGALLPGQHLRRHSIHARWTCSPNHPAHRLGAGRPGRGSEWPILTFASNGTYFAPICCDGRGDPRRIAECDLLSKRGSLC